MSGSWFLHFPAFSPLLGSTTKKGTCKNKRKCFKVIREARKILTRQESHSVPSVHRLFFFSVYDANKLLLLILNAFILCKKRRGPIYCLGNPILVALLYISLSVRYCS